MEVTKSASFFSSNSIAYKKNKFTNWNLIYRIDDLLYALWEEYLHLQNLFWLH